MLFFEKIKGNKYQRRFLPLGGSMELLSCCHDRPKSRRVRDRSRDIPASVRVQCGLNCPNPRRGIKITMLSFEDLLTSFETCQMSDAQNDRETFRLLIDKLSESYRFVDRILSTSPLFTFEQSGMLNELMMNEQE